MYWAQFKFSLCTKLQVPSPRAREGTCAQSVQAKRLKVREEECVVPTFAACAPVLASDRLSELEPVATQKKAPARRKNRRWLMPKLLLLFACAVLIMFIGAILMMEKELRRVGLFGTASLPLRSPAQAQAPSALLPEGTTRETKPAPPATEEITPEDRKQLDDILRARGGK